MIDSKALVFMALMVPAAAASLDLSQCVKPSYPACAFDAEIHMDQSKLDACYVEVRKLSELQNEYRNCLWDARYDAIAEIDFRLFNLIAEVAAYHQFNSCRAAAGQSATRADIERCPVPEFAIEQGLHR